MVTGQALTPEDFRNLAFSRFPKWIGWLMNFRNAIVKPLGLDTATRFTDMVLDKNLHEEILGMLDKHLDFHVSMWCGEYHEGKQELRITTVVKYNNWLGRAYFFIIRPFHGIIVKSILKHVAGDRGSIYLSGATRNRTLSPSSCISLLFRNGKRVISSYCSTVGLLRFAHRCSG